MKKLCIVALSCSMLIGTLHARDPVDAMNQIAIEIEDSFQEAVNNLRGSTNQDHASVLNTLTATQDLVNEAAEIVDQITEDELSEIETATYDMFNVEFDITGNDTLAADAVIKSLYVKNLQAGVGTFFQGQVLISAIEALASEVTKNEEEAFVNEVFSLAAEDKEEVLQTYNQAIQDTSKIRLAAVESTNHILDSLNNDDQQNGSS